MPADALFREMIQRALGASQVIAWDWDLVTGACRRLGPTLKVLGIAADAPAQAFFDLIDPQDRASVMQGLDRTRDQLEPFFGQFRITLPEGEQRWVEAIGSARLDAGGHCVAIAGALQDISVRKQVEQKLIEAERKMAEEVALLRHIHDLLLLEPEALAAEKRRIQLLEKALEASEAQMAVVHRFVDHGAASVEAVAVLAPVFSAAARQTLLPAIVPICEQARKTGRAMVLTRDMAPPQIDQSLHTAMAQYRIGGLQCVPLRLSDEQISGTLTTLWCGSDSRSTKQMLVLEVIAVKLAGLESEKTDVVHLPATGRGGYARMQLTELTPQQQRIAEMLAAAQSNRAIASALQIAENTVKAHVATILRRLGLRSRVQLVVLKHSLRSAPPLPRSITEDDQDQAGG